MQPVISDDVLENVSILAKLDLSADEKEIISRDMTRMLEYVDRISELNTQDVQPLIHLWDEVNVYREDIVTGDDGHRIMLANAPEVSERSIVVPKTVE